MTEKIQADLMIRGGTVLTMDDGRAIENGAVAITGDTIAFVGRRARPPGAVRQKTR